MGDEQKTILICSNYAWTIYNFRMPLIRSLKKKGYVIYVLTQYDGYETYIEREVHQIKPLFISRKGINPFLDLLTILDFIRYFKLLRPDILLPFTIKPVIYGSIVARIFKVRSIAMITGLGTAFMADTWIMKVVKILYRFALSSASTVFFQNVDDKNLFVKNKLVSANVCRLSPGSGIDLNTFCYVDPPKKDNMVFLLVARMLWDKGVEEFVKAARLTKLKYPQVDFQLLGPLGVENRTAISDRQMDDWCKEGFIKYLGETDNVAKYMEKACCIVLPSYREGTSRVLLEGAAIGRPLIASDVPGCREVIEHGVTGFLCKPRDYLDLSEKFEQMISMSFQARKIMGVSGHKKVTNEFAQNIVCNLYIDAIELYK